MNILNIARACQAIKDKRLSRSSYGGSDNIDQHASGPRRKLITSQLIGLPVAYAIFVVYLILFGTIVSLTFPFIAWLVASLLSLFVSVKWDRTIELHVTRQRAGSLVLIISAFPIFMYAWRGVQIPRIIMPVNAIYEGFNGATGISFNFVANFSTVGTFSAENPIHVQAIINNVNVSNFLDYVGSITFAGAFNASGLVFVNNVTSASYLMLSQSGNGEYVAEGDLVWHSSMTTYLVIIAPFQTMFMYPLEHNPINPILSISSVSDTLSFQSNQLTTQLTYVLIGFSVLTLQPVLNALFRSHAEPTENQQKSSRQKPQK